jgi:hypothetical protein
MLTAQKYYAKPENRRRALECARGNSPVRVPGHLWALRLRACPAGGGVWAVNEKTGERTGAYTCDRFPAWRKLDRPRSRIRGEEISDWYADTDGCETIRPYVLQLPSRGGARLYVPATDRSDSDGVTLYLGDVIREAGSGGDDCDAVRDAWQRANRCAELEAEAAREADMRFQAEQECERLAEESAKLLAQILEDRRAHAEFVKGCNPAACSEPAHRRALHALCERIDNARESRHANFARRRELRASPWLIEEGR